MMTGPDTVPIQAVLTVADTVPSSPVLTVADTVLSPAVLTGADTLTAPDSATVAPAVSRNGTSVSRAAAAGYNSCAPAGWVEHGRSWVSNQCRVVGLGKAREAGIIGGDDWFW